MSTLRTLRKLVLGETWTLPAGGALTLLAALAARGYDDTLWRRAGGTVLVAGVLLTLVAAAPHRRRPGRSSRALLATGSLAAVVVLAAFGLARYGPRSAPPATPTANQAFRSPADTEAPAGVWAIGDGAKDTGAARALSRMVTAERPDRLLYLGDVYELGGSAEFRTNFTGVYGDLAKITAPTPGNHDWPAHRDGYDPFWRELTGAPTPPWYALRIGGWRLISLNSEAAHGSGSEQLRWLEGQLRAARGTCTIAFWHRPRFSAGRHGDQDDMTPIWDALRGHATLVLSGHDHNLQRFAPVDGLTQYVIGAGGKSHYGLSRDQRLRFGDDRADGALHLALRPGAAALEVVSAAGRTLDRSSARCRPATR